MKRKFMNIENEVTQLLVLATDNNQLKRYSVRQPDKAMNELMNYRETVKEIELQIKK